MRSEPPAKHVGPVLWTSRTMVVPHRDGADADLAFDVMALLIEERFDRGIQRRLGKPWSGGSGLHEATAIFGR